MPRNLMSAAVMLACLGCLPDPSDQSAPVSRHSGGGPVGPSNAPAVPRPGPGPEGPSVPPGDGVPSNETSFPEDAPHGFLMAVEDCADLVAEPGSDPKPSEQRVFTVLVPERARVLRVEAGWTKSELKRALAVGPGACPPCESKDRAKGHGSVQLELPVLDGEAGRPWFVALSCDPAEDDLGTDTPALHVQSCSTAADGGARGLFPPEGLDPGGQSIFEHDAFGMQGFDGVHTATYQGGRLLAYVAATRSPADAKQLATAYKDYLSSLGGEGVIVEDPQNAVGVRNYGLNTIIFTRGSYVGGVQEAANLQSAIELATQLADWLCKV